MNGLLNIRSAVGNTTHSISFLHRMKDKEDITVYKIEQAFKIAKDFQKAVQIPPEESHPIYIEGGSPKANLLGSYSQKKMKHLSTWDFTRVI